MNIFSGFDGMSCGQIAAEKSNLKIDKYYACEIEEESITVTQANYKNTIQLGNVLGVNVIELEHIDIVIGGSPCQDISGLKKNNKGVEGEKSSLFFEYLRLLEEARKINPEVFFLLENVSGNKKAIDTITRMLGVRPIKLNSNLVCAQNRPRFYWTNIPVNSMPIKSNYRLSDVLQENVDEKYYQTPAWNNWWDKNKYFQLEKSYSTINAERANCLTKRMYASWNGNFIQDERGIRRLTPVECERLQCVPDNYTNYVSDTKRYEMLGNGWTVDIISHIFSHLPFKFKKQ